MIIDADTHISPTGGEFSVEKHLERMARAGIDKTLVWLRPDYEGTGIEGHNKYIYDAVQKYPDKLIGFGWADPTVSVKHALKMVRICTEEYGFYGVKMNGAQNHYYIDDPELGLPVAEAIAGTGKAIAFHIGPDEYERTHPFRAAKIARMFPETPVLMVHMGMTNVDLNNAVIEMALECPNMALVGSATTYKAILQAIETLGASRVCFGTDAPFQWPHVVRAMYNSALEGEVTQKEKSLVMGGNIARILKL
ncbi:MAG: amidohydrolase [Candidatus Abyssobacteria bacterium SURF_5]|uniref:Amidohydrolase n=1 Tax=Abyssobacteria bacterium (strain SURF_5) TaxID=2093360 RepID=A0A3A4P0H1_ABYX5|nr:MAG: amidohydrolase [Candidatus Abyssubacteria bacterium SURF_5]